MGPLQGIAIGWLFGLWLAYGFNLSPQPLWALAGMAGAAALATWQSGAARRDGQRLPALPYLAAALAAGLCSGVNVQPPHAPPSGLAALEVEVLQTQADAAGGFASDVRVIAGHMLDGGEPVPRGVRLRLQPEPLPEGTRLALRARLSPAREFRNTQPHPPWPVPDPLSGYGRLLGAVRILGTPSPLRHALGRIRARVRERLAESLSGLHAGLAQALLLGDRLAVHRDVRDQVSAAGLAHVLAVSGLHIGILAGAAMQLLRFLLLHMPRLALGRDVGRIAFAAGIPLALLLGPLCGGAASAMRASVTAAITWALGALYGRPRAPQTLALAVLVLSSAAPENALSLGFVLSITATAGVLLAVIDRPSGRLAALRTALRVSVACTLMTTAPILWCFGQIPLVGVAANLLVVPWASMLLVPGAAVHACIASTLPWCAPLSTSLFEFFSTVFLHMATTAADIAPAISLPAPTPTEGVLLAILCTVAALHRHLRPRHLLALCTLCVLGLVGAELHLRLSERPEGQLRVTFLDVGQGDAALVDLPDGRLLVVDAGGDPVGHRDPGARVLVPLLQQRRRSRIDLAILSHPHPDHYGGLQALLSAFPLWALWDNSHAELAQDLSPSAATTAQLLGRARQRGTRVLGPRALCDRPQTLGDVSLTVLWPCPGPDEADSVNDNSLVVRLDYGATSILFAGDIERSTEATLVERGQLGPVTVLKVPHHGSRTSSTAPFLRAIKPRLAVISAGRQNAFGHPHAESLARLRAHSARVLQVAESGSVTVTSDGKHARFVTWSGEGGVISAPEDIPPLVVDSASANSSTAASSFGERSPRAMMVRERMARTRSAGPTEPSPP